jgi:type I restriction enzyme R subunit
LGVGDKKSNLSFLIVKDMLLTGFDAPIAQVMYLDRKLTDHTLLQAIARVNRTNKNKFSGYIVDYYGLGDYLNDALDMFSSEDVEGALKNLKDEIPKLKNAHTRVLKHFDGLDLDDLDECILSLEEEIKRQVFQIDFQKFAKQLDIILPDPAANPFLKDLRRLGKISVGARNLYRDEQLDITGAGEKVRKLIEEHVYSTGVDVKIKPVDLLAKDFKEKLGANKNPRTQAAEIKSAIRTHIAVRVQDDPEYYKALSKKLEDLIQKHSEKWEELVQLLLNFRDDIEANRVQGAKDLGLTETEFSFHSIMLAEITKLRGDDSLDEVTYETIKEVVQSLVQMLDEASQIVDFFKKFDDQKTVKKNIKRMVIKHFDLSLVKPVTDRFMELARVKFK